MAKKPQQLLKTFQRVAVLHLQHTWNFLPDYVEDDFRDLSSFSQYKNTKVSHLGMESGVAELRNHICRRVTQWFAKAEAGKLPHLFRNRFTCIPYLCAAFMRLQLENFGCESRSGRSDSKEQC